MGDDLDRYAAALHAARCERAVSAGGRPAFTVGPWTERPEPLRDLDRAMASVVARMAAADERARLGMVPLSAEMTPEQAAEFRERFEAAMANPGPLVVLPPDGWNARAEEAEAKLAGAAAVQDRLRGHLDAIARQLPAIRHALEFTRGHGEAYADCRVALEELDAVWPF